MFICNLLLVGLLALQPAYAQEIQPDINNQNVQISKQERVLEPTSSVDNAQNTSEKEITVSDDKLELEPEDLKSKEETSGQDSFVSSSDDEEPPPPVVPKPPTVDPYKLLKGLVGSQETNLFTGAAGYQWQVPLPAGRQGLTPQLHLQYSSDMRMFDSLVGYGWMFDAGSIFRSTEQGKNNLYNNPHFSISQDGGTQELVLLNDAAQTYATRYGQDYRLYSFANNTWVVTHTNGTRYTYGVDTTGRLTNPDDASQTYKWVLQTVEDVHGNSIKYTYTTNGGGNLYPETIVYSDHQNVAALYQVRFVYEDRLAYTSYQRAFKVETNRRLAGIELYERSSGSFQLFRSYQLAYNQVNNAMQHLTSITAKAADNTTLPPVEFTYYDGTEGAEHQLPYLLKSVVSPFGGNTTYEYIPASLLRIEGQPRNFHPFPVQVVTRTIEQSGFGNADVITSYSFEGGHQFYEPADAYQRAYAGFHHATVTQADGSTQHVYHHQSQYSPDNDTSVLQGERLDHISKRGRVYRTEVYNPQLQLVQASIQHWEHQALPTVDATKDRFLVELETAIELAYEGTQTPKATATTYSYDEYGNVKHQLGEVTLTSDAGDFTDSLQDDRRTEMQYIENLNDYIVSYPYSRKSTNNGVFYGSEEWYYDGLPLSQASKGLMTTHLQKLQNTKRGGSITTEYEYNNYGLITLQRSPNGHNTTFTYDAHMLYPAVTINPLKHQTLYSYDYRHGIPASVTSPNGAQQAWMYDAYGRVLEERVSNSDAQSLLTKTTYTYNDAATPVLLMVENAITQTVSNNSYYYYDGNGRVVQSRVTSDTPGVYAITTTQYDDQGRPYKTSLPTEVTSTNYSSFTAPSALITETAFDSLDRPLINTTVLGTTTFSYLPWQVQKIDSEAHQLDFITDAYGNTTKVIEHNSGTTYETSYTYDANNNLTEVLDAIL
jgi:YD repeat-containing protein